MKRSIIAIALLCLCGCSEERATKDIMSEDSIWVNLNGAYGDADSVYPGAVWYPDQKCQTAIDFANWCKKAHPDVWREYSKTICEE